jgi:hypothetical protein
MSGFWLSITVTRKLQLARLPTRSVALHVTLLGPTPKSVVPIAGVHVVDATPMLSVAVGAFHETRPVAKSADV